MFIEYALLGIVIGFLSGMFGIGGSLLSTPILKIVFNLPDFIAIASPLPVTIPTAIAGTYSYWKKGIIKKDIAFASILGGLPATILGAYLTKFINSEILMVLTGIFVLITGIRLLQKGKLKASEHKKPTKTFILAMLIGIVAGIFSGLLAVGGGIILIPGFILILGLTMQEAASTSLFCIAFLAIPGTIVHWKLHHIDWGIVLSLSAGVIPASYLGAKVALILKSKHLQIMFSVFMIIFGIYFVLQQSGIL